MYNPCFDVAPAVLIMAIVTENHIAVKREGEANFDLVREAEEAEWKKMNSEGWGMGCEVRVESSEKVPSIRVVHRDLVLRYPDFEQMAVHEIYTVWERAGRAKPALKWLSSPRIHFFLLARSTSRFFPYCACAMSALSGRCTPSDSWEGQSSSSVPEVSSSTPLNQPSNL